MPVICSHCPAEWFPALLRACVPTLCQPGSEDPCSSHGERVVLSNGCAYNTHIKGAHLSCFNQHVWSNYRINMRYLKGLARGNRELADF